MADYPISKEAVIKELVELRETLSCSYISIGLTMAIDRLNGFPQFETPAPEWICVEDRLPESSACVIAICDDGFMILTSYYGGHWNWNGRYEDSVTHWMPLPEPPKEE